MLLRMNVPFPIPRHDFPCHVVSVFVLILFLFFSFARSPEIFSHTWKKERRGWEGMEVMRKNSFQSAIQQQEAEAEWECGFDRNSNMGK